MMNRAIVVIRIRGGRVTAVEHRSEFGVRLLDAGSASFPAVFALMADSQPRTWIAWLDETLQPFLSDVREWPRLVRHDLEVLHLSCFQRCDWMAQDLGFADYESPYLIPGPLDRRFATWLISPACGIGLSDVLRAAGPDRRAPSAAAMLFSLGYRGGRNGICAYSEPKLLARTPPPAVFEALRRTLAPAELAELAAQLYGDFGLLRWLACHLLFRRSLPLRGLWRALTRTAPPVDVKTLQSLAAAPAADAAPRARVDVVIPTLGRAACVLDLLRDLAEQTLRPRRVVVIEQAQTRKVVSLKNEWPFELVYRFLEQPGACRARNVGLAEVSAEWVLLLDDDVRLQPSFLARMVATARAYRVAALSAPAYSPGEHPEQVARPLPGITNFLSGNASLIRLDAARDVGLFDETLEGGYGEDYDYGVRLRLGGHAVLCGGQPVLHLRPDTGGFRARLPAPWQQARVRPKPSPTVLYSRRKYGTASMRLGYGCFYFASLLRETPCYRWPDTLVRAVRQWKASECWACRLAARCGDPA